MKIVYIDSQEHLSALAEQLMRVRSFAFDLEFDKNRFHYGFTMCLMQIAFQDTCYIIDPLSPGVDVKTIFPVIESENVEKLGFELGEDIRLFKHLGAEPKRLYDVSVATKLLDYGQVSLSNALHEILGVDTSKQSQKSNWMKRPLSQAQINYAAEDVVYLEQLKSRLSEVIDNKGMGQWVAEEQKALEKLKGDAPGIDSYIKPRDQDGFNEVDWYVFEGLLTFREEQAAANNRPPFQVLDKEFLMKMSQEAEYIKKFMSHGRALRSLRTEAFKSRLGEVSSALRRKALENGADPDKPARPKQDKELTRQTRQQKKEENKLVDELLKPIQDEIKRQYGEQAAVYLLGSKLMKELASGEFQNLLPYKRTLVMELGAKLKIDLSPIGLQEAV